MKLHSINGTNESKHIKFDGNRIFRNKVAQLAKSNAYSLTEPNQRAISNAIKELGKIPKLDNIKFLLNTAAKSTYSTSIQLDNAPINDWKGQLVAAALSAAAMLATVPQWINNKVEEINNNKSLNKQEKEILELRKNILSKTNLEQIKNETIGTIKDFEKNLNYLIISSETTLEHKKYILERLNFFMSDEYEINPQLKDKKSIAIAEMVNDMAIHTPGNEIPNIKAVNQKQHGICAAISIVRKKLAYEDKPNYVDAIISELDSTNKIHVYDRSKLGSKEKTYVEKIPVNFDAALANGYRIIDASTMHWMQIAHMTGASNLSYDIYNPFDKENFDVNNDSFFHVKFDDPELERAQAYYQSLVKANEIIEDYKASSIKKSLKNNEIYLNQQNTLEELSKISNSLKKQLTNLSSTSSEHEISSLVTNLLGLEHEYSSKIKENNEYAYIPNEEDIVKKEKIKNYITQNSSIKEISENKLSKIFDTIDYYNEINKKNKYIKNKPVSRARSLYEIAAAFRYQMIKGLDETKTLNRVMITEGISNRENLLLQTIDKLIEKLEKNSPYSEQIIKQVIPMFEELKPTKEDAIEGLSVLKETIEELLTKDMDDIYAALTYGNRKVVLLNYLTNLQNAINGNNKEVIEYYSNTLNCKKNKEVLNKKIEAIKQELISGDEKSYNKIFDFLGNKSQLEIVSNLYKETIDQMGAEDNGDFVLNFLQINNLKIEDDPNAVIDRLDLIKQKIDGINHLLSTCVQNLRIKDKNGDILFSADPKDIIIKKLENETRIIPAKNLREIQEHLEKITKKRSQDEFQSRQGKLNDKSLTYFSKQEKQTLNEIEKMINPMHAYIQKQLSYVQSDLRESLEELKRIIGLNSGHYWVNQEGSSGLFSEEKIRVLEYMTGRPHYISKNAQNAIETIKQGPYSAISSSSVFHTKPGMHAQYIADIEPVEVNVKKADGTITKETKEILFQDNTWGPSELENTWIDSNGLKRTDYSDNRGGSLGYITNEKLRNGNFVDRILNEMVVTSTPDTTNSKVYKKIKHPSAEGYHFPQYGDFILDGKSPEIKKITDQLHDTLFIPKTKDLTTLSQLVEDKYTTEEIKAFLANINGVNKNWEDKFDTLYKRIFPPFGPGIKTKEDYENLADDDYLKIVLEKMALKKNYQISGLEPELTKIKNLKDLAKFKAAQKNRAINSFKYAFGKNSYNIVDYVTQAFTPEDDIKITTILKKYNPEISDEQLDTIGSHFSIDLDRFDGSVKTTINLLMETLSKDIRNVLTNPEGIREAEKFFSDFLHRSLYFNSSDLKNGKIRHIVNFIDREFNPNDDKEFVKIYRQIQDMTHSEFKEQIISKTKAKDFGINNLTGFDMLKKIRLGNEDYEYSFKNEIATDGLYADLPTKNYKYSYRLNKLSRTISLQKNETLPFIYRNLYFDLSVLSLPKIFNQYKDRNLNKYGVFPAYPKLNYITEETVSTSFNALNSLMKEDITTIKAISEQIKNYQISNNLKEFNSKIHPEAVLNKSQYLYINKLLGDFITINLGDTSISDIIEAAENAMEIPLGSTWKDFIPYINTITKCMTEYENTSSKEILEEIRENKKRELKEQKIGFVKTYIQKKYQNRILETINQLEQAYIKHDNVKVEELSDKLYQEYRKYHILEEPSSLLEQYMISCSNDSDLKIYRDTYQKLLTRCLIYAQLTDIQDILMDAVKKGVAINVKSIFNNYSLELFGTEFKMGSNEIIAQMINSLVIDDQQETALLFIDKLGLADTYIRHMSNEIDFDGMKDNIRNAFDKANRFNHFRKEIEPAFENAINILSEENPKFAKTMNQTRKQIKTLGEKYSIEEKYLDILYKALDNIKYTTSENPNAQKGLVFNTVINVAKTQMTDTIKSDIAALDETARASAIVMDIINQILLPNDSELNEIRDRLNEEFQEIAELKQYFIDLQQQEESAKI